MRRIAIITAGGDTPALNATIAGAVTRANQRRVEVVGLIKGFSGLLNPRVPHVFLNPLYFLLLFLAEIASRPRLLALLFGAGLGPLFHLLTPDWGLLLSGLIAGSLAFALDRVLARRSHA